MPVNEDALRKLISGNAKKLCGNNNIVENASRKASNSSPFGDPDPNDFDDFGTLYDDPSFNLGGGSSMSTGDIQYSQKTMENSKVPSFIKESMLSNKIDVEAASDVSVAAEKNFKNLSRSKELMYEGKAQGTTQIAQQGLGLSKELFFKWLDEYFAQNDNALKTITLKGGNINLIDNSGNVYMAKLKKIDN
jgi:hypothetical protein